MENNDIEKRFEELISKIREYSISADFAKIMESFEFAKLAHTDEKRLSGEDYIWHPLETSFILAAWKMDSATIIAGLLHDTIEHGAATQEDIAQKFGDEILRLVEGVTKVSSVKLTGSGNELFVENLRKMFLAMAKDLRVVFIRLAERLDNLKSLKFLPKDRREKYALDSLEIYSPLSERLGMWAVKTEIDDLAFEHAYPNEYKRVKELSAPFYKKAENRIIKMKRRLLKELSIEKVSAKIYGRKKGLYSLFTKLKRTEISWNLDRVYDIVALRIIPVTINECYTVLGIVHKLYKPVPHIPLTDFIAVPKPNGYRSIHMKVFGPEEGIVEIQIRTQEMHEEAEKGAAAHWQMSILKSAGKLSSEDIDKGKFQVSTKLDWVKQLAEWQNTIKDSDEFIKAVKFDALSKRIFVFTPKGDLFDLPENSTPVDFAFAVHTKLAEYIKGAKVNDKIVPLNFKLSSGQVVDILKHKEKIKPNRDWLDFVVTTMAKREIKKSLRNN